MMDIFRQALGEDRLLGFKFCKRDQLKEHQKKHPLTKRGEAVKAYAEYLRKLEGRPDPEERQLDEDMNPNGFWEDGRFTVRGLAYRQNTKEILQEIRDAKTSLFAKIVSSGLLNTNPDYVDKVVYMLRHPRAVAKSQERLKRGSFVTVDGQDFNIADEVIHTPEMFINSSIAAAKWFVENPEVPLHIVEFDDLIENPEEIVVGIAAFICESGEFLKAYEVVDPKLRRSYPQAVENSLWGEAEIAYKLMKERKFEELIEFFDEPRRLIHREARAWHCVRFAGPTCEKQCQLCRVNDEYRGTLKQHAEEQEIPWRERPCAFEVAFDLDNPLVSIEESIRDNFWEEENGTQRYHKSPRGIFPTAFLRC
jgi:hypothetical protein